jgi:tetratricopeptide (TPR) repeat protein
LSGDAVLKTRYVDPTFEVDRAAEVLLEAEWALVCGNTTGALELLDSMSTSMLSGSGADVIAMQSAMLRARCAIVSGEDSLFAAAWDEVEEAIVPIERTTDPIRFHTAHLACLRAELWQREGGLEEAATFADLAVRCFEQQRRDDQVTLPEVSARAVRRNVYTKLERGSTEKDSDVILVALARIFGKEDARVESAKAHVLVELDLRMHELAAGRKKEPDPASLLSGALFAGTGLVPERMPLPAFEERDAELAKEAKAIGDYVRILTLAPGAKWLEDERESFQSRAATAPAEELHVCYSVLISLYGIVGANERASELTEELMGTIARSPRIGSDGHQMAEACRADVLASQRRYHEALEVVQDAWVDRPAPWTSAWFSLGSLRAYLLSLVGSAEAALAQLELMDRRSYGRYLTDFRGDPSLSTYARFAEWADSRYGVLNRGRRSMFTKILDALDLVGMCTKEKNLYRCAIAELRAFRRLHRHGEASENVRKYGLVFEPRGVLEPMLNPLHPLRTEHRIEEAALRAAMGEGVKAISVARGAEAITEQLYSWKHAAPAVAGVAVASQLLKFLRERVELIEDGTDEKLRDEVWRGQAESLLRHAIERERGLVGASCLWVVEAKVEKIRIELDKGRYEDATRAVEDLLAALGGGDDWIPLAVCSDLVAAIGAIMEEDEGLGECCWRGVHATVQCRRTSAKDTFLLLSHALLAEKRGDFELAEESLRRAVALSRESRLFSGSLRSDLLSHLGELLVARERFEEALPHFRAAHEEVEGTEHGRAVDLHRRSLRGAARCLDVMGEHGEAEQTRFRLMRKLVEQLGPFHPWTNETRKDLASSWALMGRRQEALLELHRAHVYEALSSGTLPGRIGVNRVAGLIDELTEAAEGALSIDLFDPSEFHRKVRSCSPTTFPLWLRRRELLPFDEEELGRDWIRARGCHYAHWLDPLDPAVAVVVCRSVELAVLRGEAVPEALLVQLVRSAERREAWPHAMWCLATLRAEAGRFPEALETLEELAVAVEVQVTGPAGANEAFAAALSQKQLIALRMAACCLRLGKHVRAEALFEQVAWPGQPDWELVAAQAGGRLADELVTCLGAIPGGCLGALANLIIGMLAELARSGQLGGEALELLVRTEGLQDGAISGDRAALIRRYLVEAYREYWDWTGLATKHTAHEGLWQVLAQAGSGTEGDEDTAELWGSFCVRKGVLLNRFLDFSSLAKRSNLPAARAWQVAADAFASQQEQLNRILVNARGAGGPEPSRDQLDAYDESVEILRLREHEWAAEDPGARAIREATAFTVGPLLASLPPDTAIIDYYVVDDLLVTFWSLAGKEGQDARCGMTRMSLSEVSPMVSQLQEVVRSCEGALADLRSFLLQLSSTAATARAACVELGTMLLPAPLRSGSAPRHLIVVPDGELHRVPFQVLRISTPEAEWSLLERADVQVVASVAELRRPRPASGTPPDVDATFRGVRSFDHVRVVDGDDKGGRRLLSMSQREQGGSPLGSLEGLEEEEQLVRQRWEAATWRHDSAIDDELDAAALREALGRCRIGHLATHGWVDRTDSSLESIRGFNAMVNSQLVLGRPSAPDASPFLSALAISGWDLSNVELLVLTVCDTAAGHLTAGLGVLGVQRGFRHAGVKNQIVSLWSVHPHLALALAETLYDRDLLAEVTLGTGFSAVVRRAVRVLVEQPEWRTARERLEADSPVADVVPITDVVEHPFLTGTFLWSGASVLDD